MNDVKVTIEIMKAPSKLGFGIPLILVTGADKAVAYKEYASIDEVKADYAETTDTYKMAALIFLQDSCPEKIACCSATTAMSDALDAVFDKGWRQLLLATPADGDVKAAAEYIEVRKDKMLFATVADLSEVTALGKGDRTFVWYHTNPLFAAALVGATAGLDVGSFTYKNLILKGVDPMDLADAEITEAHAVNANTFVTKAGDNVTSEGKVLSGEYADIVDSKDYIIQQIVYREQKLLNSSKKIPYDNPGISALESVVAGVLLEAYNNGMIATNEEGLPDYSVTFKPRSETDPSDRAERKYVEGTFSFGLAGAIHTVEIKGQIIV